ncbi:hypothetical protein, partial [uncultured Gammaproteobacteria bacterium]
CLTQLELSPSLMTHVAMIKQE